MSDLGYPIEDEDGNVLPPEFQRDTPLYNAVLEWLKDVTEYEITEWPKRTTDDFMVTLAPYWNAK